MFVCYSSMNPKDLSWEEEKKIISQKTPKNFSLSKFLLSSTEEKSGRKKQIFYLISPEKEKYISLPFPRYASKLKNSPLQHTKIQKEEDIAKEDGEQFLSNINCRKNGRKKKNSSPQSSLWDRTKKEKVSRDKLTPELSSI